LLLLLLQPAIHGVRGCLPVLGVGHWAIFFSLVDLHDMPRITVPERLADVTRIEGKTGIGERR
jgi:hypothetical protein